ncbi:hypothetical protein Tco_1061999, partial [Tanacetum coccineum]
VDYSSRSVRTLLLPLRTVNYLNIIRAGDLEQGGEIVNRGGVFELGGRKVIRGGENVIRDGDLEQDGEKCYRR